MANGTLLIGLIALPFAGSLTAALLPANARNLEAWLGELFALAGLVGGLCLLAGVLILGHIVGSYDLDAVLASEDLSRR